jgi:hypothetical protein
MGEAVEKYWEGFARIANELRETNFRAFKAGMEVCLGDDVVEEIARDKFQTKREKKQTERLREWKGKRDESNGHRSRKPAPGS